MPFPKRPPTFALPVGDKGLQNLEDLQNYFLVDDILRHFQSGKLHTWCQDRRYNEQLDKLYNIAETSDLTEVVKNLVFIFDVKTIFIDKEKSIDADKYFQETPPDNILNENSPNFVVKKAIKTFLDDPKNVEKIVKDYLSNNSEENKQANDITQSENKETPDLEMTDDDEYYHLLYNIFNAANAMSNTGIFDILSRGNSIFVVLLNLNEIRLNLKKLANNFSDRIKKEIFYGKCIMKLHFCKERTSYYYKIWDNLFKLKGFCKNCYDEYYNTKKSLYRPDEIDLLKKIAVERNINDVSIIYNFDVLEKTKLQEIIDLLTQLGIEDKK